MSKNKRKNVTAEMLREYLIAFHQRVVEASDKGIPEQHRQRVRHYSLASMKVTGYVSTQFGVGWEYTQSDAPSIDIVQSSKRVEDLITNIPARYMNNKSVVTLVESGDYLFVKCRFADGPIRRLGIGGSVAFSESIFHFGYYTKPVFFAEFYGDRDVDNWTIEKALSNADDEVLAASYDIILAGKDKISLEEYISGKKQKLVLMLGSYSENGKKRLDLIAQYVTNLGYEPVMLSDIKDDHHQNIRQKLTVLLRSCTLHSEVNSRTGAEIRRFSRTGATVG